MHAPDALRVDMLFKRFFGPNDRAIYKVSQQVLRGEHAWLESGIVAMFAAETMAPESGAPPTRPRDAELAVASP